MKRIALTLLALMIAVGGVGIVSENGTALLEPSSRRSRFLELSHLALRPDGMLYGTAGAREIRRTSILGTAAVETVGRTRDDDYLRRLALDGAGHVYAATTSSVFGLDAHGAEMFRVEPFDTDQLLLGEGFLIAVGMQTGSGLLRIH